MRSDIRFFGFLPILVVLTMCSPVHPPQPQPDPIHEQITILQKQLLELQIRQKESEAKFEESKNTLDTLSAKIRTVEERQAGLNRQQQAGAEAVKTDAPRDAGKKTAPQKKKTSAKKKKKKPRRQE